MRVGEGSLDWFTLDYNNASMKDLVKESFWITNSNEHIINKKVNDIMLTSGRNRVQELFDNDLIWEINPYEDWEAHKEVHDKLADIDTDKSMRLYSKAISYLTVTDWKKCIVLNYLKAGIHLSYPNSFVLDEYIDENTQSYDEETRQLMMADNKFLNEKINYYREYYYAKQEDVWQDFFDKVLPLSDYPEEFKMHLEQRSESLTDIDQRRWKKSDVDKNIISLKAGNIIQDTSMISDMRVSSELDEAEDAKDKSKPFLVRRGEEVKFRQYLSEFRDKLHRIRYINMDVACKVLEIGNSTARKKAKQAEAELAKIVGLDVLSFI